MEPFRRADRIWLLALPIYLMILVVRHEASHAVVSLTYDDARVTSFALLPRFVDGKLVRPHVRTVGSESWVTRLTTYVTGTAALIRRARRKSAS